MKTTKSSFKKTNSIFGNEHFFITYLTQRIRKVCSVLPWKSVIKSAVVTVHKRHQKFFLFFLLVFSLMLISVIFLFPSNSSWFLSELLNSTELKSASTGGPRSNSVLLWRDSFVVSFAQCSAVRLFNFQLKINKRENQVICEAVDEGGVDVTTDFYLGSFCSWP